LRIRPEEAAAAGSQAQLSNVANPYRSSVTLVKGYIPVDVKIVLRRPGWNQIGFAALGGCGDHLTRG
jgi:hypothetical protein